MTVLIIDSLLTDQKSAIHGLITSMFTGTTQLMTSYERD